MRILKHQDFIAGLCIFGISLNLWVYTLDFPSSSGAFPKGILITAMVLSVIMVLRSIALKKWREQEFEPFVIHGPKLLIAMIGLTLYFAVAGYIGYFTATIIYMPALAYFLGFRDYKYIALTTLVYVLFSYLVFFHLMSMDLPEEKILKLFGI